jgi:3-hydroxyisobutyrate dehydrogenase-like beta-hydroxyacid dehydrogenase
VPNDKVLNHVVSDPQTGLLSTLRGVHVSCSTIHPDTSRQLAALHQQHGSRYVGAPIFARADGVAKKLASFVVGGDDQAVEAILPILECNSNGVFRFGTDPGAGNVVKLSGNFMIACAIESCAEALSLAEKNGVDRVKMMEMLSSTIFDCLIYKGYGMRTAHRQHIPGQELVGPGFQLDLGLKDVTLAQDVAHKVQSPMPFASVLHDRLLASQARGRGQMDWSAMALLTSEDAGIDVSQWLPADKM